MPIMRMPLAQFMLGEDIIVEDPLEGPGCVRWWVDSTSKNDLLIGNRIQIDEGGGRSYTYGRQQLRAGAPTESLGMGGAFGCYSIHGPTRVRLMYEAVASQMAGLGTGDPQAHVYLSVGRGSPAQFEITWRVQGYMEQGDTSAGFPSWGVVPPRGTTAIEVFRDPVGLTNNPDESWWSVDGSVRCHPCEPKNYRVLPIGADGFSMYYGLEVLLMSDIDVTTLAPYLHALGAPVEFTVRMRGRW